MSAETINLLHLFSKLLRYPRFMFALRMDMTAQRLKNRQGRNGAQGLAALLAEKDGLTNAEIAEKLDIKPSSVTAQVKMLESKGLIKRIVDENDKRVSRVFLTEKGLKMHSDRNKKQDTLSEDIFGCLTKEEQQRLGEILEKLIEEGSNWTEGTFTVGMDGYFDSLTDRHNVHRMGNEFRRAQREFQNEFRRHMRDGLPFGEDWKFMLNQLKDNIKENFQKDTDDQDFEAHWNNFKNNFDAHNPWNSGKTDKTDKTGYFDQKRSNFRDQPFHKNFDESNSDPKATTDNEDPDNWDDF